ncbi:MAG: hypothetical protein H6Q70_2728 [Firmicutes bacterium]|nr:hypothetical protein [Bacillota bacterium]
MEENKEKILQYLYGYKRKTIALDTLESVCSGRMEYAEFVAVVQALVASGVLSGAGAKQREYRGALLCMKYKINVNALYKDTVTDIQSEIIREQFYMLMDFSYYFKHPRQEWMEDKPYLLKISQYLYAQGLPKESASDQERSYEIFGDEKIFLRYGLRFLDRVGLTESFNISNEVEPLMLAINPHGLLNQSVHRHLIVENKATYYALLDVLKMTKFSTLVFGSGWKIANNLVALPRQIGLPEAKHQYYYFGDFDHEGISIYYALYEQCAVELATEFYCALFTKPASRGKSNQVKNEAALACFKAKFSQAFAEKVEGVLATGQYYPQESLTQAELSACWRKYNE